MLAITNTYLNVRFTVTSCKTCFTFHHQHEVEDKKLTKEGNLNTLSQFNTISPKKEQKLQPQLVDC